MLVLFYITFITNGMTYNFLLVVVAVVVLSPVFTALFISSSELAPLGDLLLPLLLYVTQSHNTLYYHNYHVIHYLCHVSSPAAPTDSPSGKTNL